MKILNEFSFYMCIMAEAEKQQNILNFKEFEVFYKNFKISIFGKLTGGFENFLCTIEDHTLSLCLQQDKTIMKCQNRFLCRINSNWTFYH